MFVVRCSESMAMTSKLVFTAVHEVESGHEADWDNNHEGSQSVGNHQNRVFAIFVGGDVLVEEGDQGEDHEVPHHPHDRLNPAWIEGRCILREQLNQDVHPLSSQDGFGTRNT